MESIKLISPLLAVFAASGLVLLFGLFEKTRKSAYYITTSLAGILASWLCLIGVWQFKSHSLFQGGIIVDPYGLILGFLITFAMFLVILMSQGYAEVKGHNTGEYYSLILMAGGAMMVMAMSTHFITLFVALETFSIGVYALAGIIPGNRRAKEGALKYFVLGSLASAILLYGMALLYGASGTLDLASPKFSQALHHPWVLAGIGLVTVGLAFKVSAVPFHWWAPDVYEGAPLPITGYMATAVKIGGFAFFGRVAIHLFQMEWLQTYWQPVIWALAVITMLVGSVLALVQKNIKRLLAYSSIVHAGYLLIAIYVSSISTEAAKISSASMIFYLATYLVITLGAFAAIIAFSSVKGDLEIIDSYRGLGYRSPFVAFGMALFLFALAGIPPTAGFMGKFYVFMGAIQMGCYWLGGLAILASMVSLYYYLRVIVVMYMSEPESEDGAGYEFLGTWGARCVLAITIALTFGLGILPGAYFELTRRTAEILFGG